MISAEELSAVEACTMRVCGNGSVPLSAPLLLPVWVIVASLLVPSWSISARLFALPATVAPPSVTPWLSTASLSEPD